MLIKGVSLVAQKVKCLPAMQETWVRSLGQEDPLEKEMTTHSNTLDWIIPWTEKPSRLQFMGSQRSDKTEWLHFLSFFLSFFAHQKHLLANGDFPGGATGKEPACQCRRHKRLSSIPGLGRSLEDGMATHSSKSHEQRSLGGTINGATRVAHNWSDLAFRHTLANAHRRKFSLSEKKVILSNIQHI